MPEVTRDILYVDTVLSIELLCLINYRSVNIVIAIVTGYSTKIYSVYCTTVNVAD